MSRPLCQSSRRVDHTTLVATVTTDGAAEARCDREQAVRAVLTQIHHVVAAVLGRGSPDIEDAAQEAFERVYRGIPAFRFDPDKPGGPSAWVNVVAQRVACDRRRAASAGSRDEPHAVEDGACPDPIPLLDRTKLVGMVLRCLDDGQRAVLVLRHWNDCTDEEIASTLRIPLGTVKTRARAARLKLNHVFREDPEAWSVARGVLLGASPQIHSLSVA